MTIAQREALLQIAEAAIASERAAGVPALLTAAQTIQESGWLAHCPGCNAFGVKAHAGHERQLLRTREWFTDEEMARFLARGDGRTAELVQPEQRSGKRRLYAVRDWFAKYATLAEGLADHARLISEGARYAEAWQQYRQDGDVEDLVKGIAPVYATDPGYADQLLRIMRMPEVRAAIAEAKVAALRPQDQAASEV
ncbi:MAG: glucosaminidase domain-containing protein [Bryobacteraceae bacterium]